MLDSEMVLCNTSLLLNDCFFTGAQSDHVILIFLTYKEDEGFLHHLLEDCQNRFWEKG